MDVQFCNPCNLSIHFFTQFICICHIFFVPLRDFLAAQSLTDTITYGTVRNI